ncbi:hypothetical protein Tco_0278512 [Tanacetum coccineum]
MFKGYNVFMEGLDIYIEIAYIFTRLGKKEAAKKYKKQTELPSTPEMKTAPNSEGTAITPSNEPEKLQVPVPESQWTKEGSKWQTIKSIVYMPFATSSRNTTDKTHGSERATIDGSERATIETKFHG